MAHDNPNNWGDYFRSLSDPKPPARAPASGPASKSASKSAASPGSDPSLGPKDAAQKPPVEKSGFRRGIIALVLVGIPLVAFPFFWNAPWRWILAGAVAVIVLLLGSYFFGRARSVRLKPFFPSAEVDRFGENVLGNRAVGAGIGIIACASLFVFLPSNFGAADSEQNRDAPPPKSLTNDIQKVHFFLGWEDTHDKVRYFAAENINPDNLAVLNNTVRKPPKGYRWILYYLTAEVLDKESEFYTSNMSIKLIDANNRVYLPDYGAGANNAPDGYARVGERPFWTPAYLVPNNVKPVRFEVVPSQGSDTILYWTYPTKLEYKRLVAEYEQSLAKQKAKAAAAKKAPQQKK